MKLSLFDWRGQSGNLLSHVMSCFVLFCFLVSAFSYSLPSFFSFINLPYLRPWPERLSYSCPVPAGTVPSLSSDQRKDLIIDLSLGKRVLYFLIFSIADTRSSSLLPPHSSYFLCTLLPQARRAGSDPKPLGEGRTYLFGSGALLATAEITVSPFLENGVGLEVGSNSAAAKFHSSVPAILPVSLRPSFLLTKSLYLVGEKSILFLNLFSNLNTV